MLKRILIFLLFLGFIGGLGYSYLYFKQKKQPVSNTMNAIPPSAAFIIESKNSISSWGKLSSSNIIWSELQATKYFSELNSTIEIIDSVRIENQNFNKLIQQQPVFISAHMSGAHSFDFLFCISIPNTISQEQVFDFIWNKLDPQDKTSKKYDEATIHLANFGKEKTSFTYHEGILIISKSTILVEDAIRQINSGTSLLEISDFQRIVHTAGKNIDANLYINYKVLPNILSTFVKEEHKNVYESFSDIANWAEIDLSLSPNAIAFNGFTYSSDSVNNYMNVFIDQKPVQQELLEMLPKNTAFLVRTGFSNFKMFQNRYKTYLEKNNKLFEFGAKLKFLENSHEFDAAESFYNWIDDEIALVITEPKNNNFEQQSFAILKSNDIEYTNEKLTQLFRKQEKSTADSSEYKDFTIRNIAIPQLLSTLFNSSFVPIKNNYFTTIDDYVVMGNTASSIRDFINYYLNKKTLLKNEEFIQFYENISSESNLLIYSNVSRSTKLYKSFLNEDLNQYIEQYETLYKKFDGIAIQVSKDRNNMYYNNIFLHYNPIYKQETSSLWETQLDTTLSRKPQIIKNHKTGAKDIVIQDDANILYQISNTGKIVWKKRLKEDILGEINQIDVYKNNKFQLLFATSSQLHLIDRNGNYVDGYPVDFTSEATSPATVLDYDNNRNYRILVAFKNKTIVNYEASGKKVNGWKFKKSKNIIDNVFQHVQISGKDYIIGLDISGNVYVLDRRGKTRIEITNKVAKNSNFNLVKKKNIQSTFITNADSLGTIYKLYLKDTLEKINNDIVSNIYHFQFADIDNDQSKDYIIQSENSIYAIDEDFNLIHQLDFENDIYNNLQVHVLDKNKIQIGITTSSNEIHLINSKGINESGFPLFGTTSFSIGDINKDNSRELIVGGNKGFIYAYTLED